MKIFYPIFHPIFRFPSVYQHEQRSIKFFKNKKLDDKANQKDKQITGEAQSRLAEYAFGGINLRVALWFFYHRK